MMKKEVLLIVITLALASSVQGYLYEANVICENECLQNTTAIWNITFTNKGIEPIDILRVSIVKSGTNLLLGLYNESGVFINTKESVFPKGKLPSYYGETEINYSVCVTTQIDPDDRFDSGVYIGLETTHCEAQNHTLYVYQCIEDEQCFDNQVCTNNTCQNIECAQCQYAQSHQCFDYACCLDSDCRENQVCQENQCNFFECSSDQTWKNHTCVPLDCAGDEFASNNTCYKLTCPEDSQPINHACVKLNCKETEYASNHTCVRLICDQNETAVNHTCVKSTVAPPMIPPKKNSVFLNLAEIFVLGAIVFVLLRILHIYHDKHNGVAR